MNIVSQNFIKNIIPLNIIHSELVNSKVDVPFQINILSNLKDKPIGDKSKKNPFLPPFEDGLFIQDLYNNHCLIYNKFPLIDKHVLVITKEFQPQNSKIDQNDIQSTILVMEEINGLAFYNSDKTAGASQCHKHIQVVPIQNLNHTYIIDFIQNLINQGIDQIPFYKFLHILIKIEKNNKEDQAMYIANLIGDNLIKLNQDQTFESYNFLMTKDWLLIIPRKQEMAQNSISMNAMVFYGSFLVKNESDLQKIKDCDPIEILKEITFN